MKTTEQINQITNMKSLLSKLVEEHKATKKVARMSSNNPEYSVSQTGSAQWKDVLERQHLCVIYTAYFILRHYFENEAAVDAYIDDVLAHLKKEKQQYSYSLKFFGYDSSKLDGNSRWSSYGSFKEAVKGCLRCIEIYAKEHKPKGAE